MRLAATGAPGRQNQKKHMTHTRKKALTYVYVSLYICARPPTPQCGVCAQSGPASPRLGFASGGGGVGSPAQACPGCAGVRTPEVCGECVLESGPTC